MSRLEGKGLKGSLKCILGDKKEDRLNIVDITDLTILEAKKYFEKLQNIFTKKRIRNY